MRLPTVREAELFLRRSLRILTPVAIVFLALSLAFEFTGWLPNLLFGQAGRRARFAPADATNLMTLAISLVGLLACGIVALSGDVNARRLQPITWHAVIDGVVFFAAGFLSLLTSRLG